MGVPQMDGLRSGKSHLEMDDDWGYHYFRKPPCCCFFCEQGKPNNFYITQSSVELGQYNAGHARPDGSGDRWQHLTSHSGDCPSSLQWYINGVHQLFVTLFQNTIW